MAGATLTSFIKWTADKLSSLVGQASSSSSDYPFSSEQELLKLEVTMRWIHATLDDAEEREISEKSELLRLRELKEVADDAEDVVDEYEYEVLRVKVRAPRQAMDSHKGAKNDEVLEWNSYHPRASISYELTRRIGEIRERFKEITSEWQRISFREKDGKKRRVKKWQPMETTSFYDKATTFGREDEKKTIMEWLLQGTKFNDVKVSVLPIVGMGGLGKTTLAQMVYNDPLVLQKFYSRGWVCVSDDFEVTSLMRKIIIAFSSMKLDSNLSLDELYMILMEMLEGKKFLLILDDVWNEKADLWDSMKSILGGAVGAGAGKIIVTTRNETVAGIMQTTLPIYLSNLSFENCWLLFKKIAFEAGDPDSYKDLLDIGKDIVRKCQGLPLAVKVLASILSTEDDEETWFNILRSDLWELEEEKGSILPALKLSYNRMPIELRPCFIYLSLFPKDTRLYRQYIVQLWMSQGFLQPRDNKMEEDVGNAYVNELLHRSFLQYDNRLADDGFIMHDLIHDLAQSISQDEHLLITTDELHPIPRRVRHLSVYFTDNFDIVNLKPLFESELQTSRLRTLILHRANGFCISDLFLSLKCLRTLVLVLKEHIHFSDSLGNLKHLRYLKFSDVESTPQSMYKLYHLQTLHYEKFQPGIKLKLSKDIGDLLNLRHLWGYNQHCLHQEVAGLTNLQTLKHFHVGAESWQCKMKHLKDLANITGELRVAGLETVSWSDITPVETYLKFRRGIERLDLQWTYSGRREEKDDKFAAQVLRCLQPHSNLRELHILHCPGAMFPAWLGDASFTKLQELELLNCNFLSLPALGQLRALKRLLIGRMKRVRSVGREFLCPVNPAAVAAAGGKEGVKRSSCCFPSLEALRFMEMEEWEEWNEVEDCDFPCLRRLHVYKCTKLRRLPSLTSLGVLNVRLCPKLRTLPSLPSVTELELWGRIELLSGCCLTALRSLNIHWYGGPTLVLSDYQSLGSLEELAIEECFGLGSLSGLGNLVSLRSLVIRRCSELRISPDDHLPPNIREVEIDDESSGAQEWYQNQVSEQFGTSS